MNNCVRLRALRVFFASHVALFLISGAGGQDRPPNTLANGLVFTPPPAGNKKITYGEGTYVTDYTFNSRCSITEADYLLKKHNLMLAWSGIFKDGDVVGVMGGVFRARCL